jgi:hypothetical protein
MSANEAEDSDDEPFVFELDETACSGSGGSSVMFSVDVEFELDVTAELAVDDAEWSLLF